MNDNTLFEQIKHTREDGGEYWSARELAPLLGYKQWRQFSDAIDRAKESCETASQSVFYDFAEVRKIVSAGATSKPVKDYELSRYACYLIAMNGDPRKEEIATAQAYFAVQTRRQELADEALKLTEDEKRLAIRAEVKDKNKALFATAQNAGVKNFGRFNNRGYEGLYNGEDEQKIHRRKKLGEKEKILDHMGSTELAANWFRITQADDKIKRENIKGDTDAGAAHYQVGKKVRETIAELGGTMPEELPTPKKSIKQLKKEEAARLADKDQLKIEE